MTAKDIIFLNQVVQGIHDVDRAVEWFRGHEAEEQVHILQQVGYIAIEAGATAADALNAAEMVGVKSGTPACVMMSKQPSKTQLAKVLGLPEAERQRSFAFLLGLLIVADERRRETKCQGKCSHWWHRDLRNQEVVNDIIDSGVTG
jgi:hypothetical protein